MTAPMLTVADVAQVTRLSAYTVRAAIRDGELAASKIRGRYLVSSDDLAAWLDAGKVRPQGVVVSGRLDRPAPRPRPVPPAGSAREAIRAMKATRRNVA